MVKQTKDGKAMATPKSATKTLSKTPKKAENTPLPKKSPKTRAQKAAAATPAPPTPKTPPTVSKKQKKKAAIVIEDSDEDVVVEKTVESTKVVPKKEEIKEEAEANDAKTKSNIKSAPNKKKVSTAPAASKKHFDATQRIQEAKDQALSAISSLKKFFADKNDKSLFPDVDYALSISVSYKKPAIVTDQGRLKIQIPNSGKTINNTTICVIMPDLDQSDDAKREFDVEKQAREWADKIEKDHGLTNAHITKIMTKREVERVAHTYKDRRALASQYDMFLADERIYKSTQTFLGKEFYRAHKAPLPFRYEKPMTTTIENALRTVIYPLKRYLPRVSVNVGHLGQSTVEIHENISAVLDAISKGCPGGFFNIRNIYLHPSSADPQLPIYADDGSATEIKLPLSSKRDNEKLKEVVDDCSTLPEGLKLAVRNNGRIRVLKEDTSEAVLYPTIKDEWSERDSIKVTIDPAKVLKKRIKRKKTKEFKAKQALLRAKAKAKKRQSGIISSAPEPKKTKTKAYYTVCALTYPIYVGINYKSYVPDRAQILGGRSLRDEILNPKNVKKI
ncbi:unnamed protein product [Caenorhabditis bovis]|uniref:Uncharacterized protein n=1 Tax=Caenorhabditis bovis TaxID=2654633 RepID=A0A8S1E265_9PELO|nr:unnamed protein product [Caenorhabditis bovis]